MTAARQAMLWYSQSSFSVDISVLFSKKVPGDFHQRGGDILLLQGKRRASYQHGEPPPKSSTSKLASQNSFWFSSTAAYPFFIQGTGIGSSKYWAQLFPLSFSAFHMKLARGRRALSISSLIIAAFDDQIVRNALPTRRRLFSPEGLKPSL